MAKKVAKKLKSAIESTVASKKVSKGSSTTNEKLQVRTSRKVAKRNWSETHGRVGVPVQESERLRLKVFYPGWKENGCAVGDPYPESPRRPIASLLEYSTLTEEDADRLKEALRNGLSPIKISFSSIYGYVFIWDYFSISWNGGVGKIQISCTQFWPKQDCPPPKRSRKFDPYFGDIEISITWPDPNDPSQLDPETEQVIVLNDVVISADYMP